MKPTLFIDMDNVIVNYYTQFAKYVKKITGVSFKYKLDELTSFTCMYWLKEIFPEKKAVQIKEKIFNDIKFWITIEPMSGAIETIKLLEDKYNVYIATSAFVSNSNSCVLGKIEWVKKHLPFIDIAKLIYCHHKYLLKGDYIIDDLPRVVEKFTGKIIIMDYLYNRFYNADYRVKNWKEIGELLL